MLLVIFSILLAVLILLAHRGMLARTQPRLAWMITIARLVALLALTLIVADLKRSVTRPEKDQCKILVFADASKSMKVNDAKMQTRLQKIESLFRDDKCINELHQLGRIETQVFADDVQSTQRLDRINILPGNTNLAAPLRQVLDVDSLGLPVAAAVLISDGRHTHGDSPIQVAKSLAAAKIPVSAVLVDEAERPHDISLRTNETHIVADAGQPFAVQAFISSNSTKTEAVTVTLEQDGAEPSSKTVQVPPNAKDFQVEFKTSSTLPGKHLLKLQATTQKQDANPDNDLDCAIVQIQQPPKMNVLYLAASLDWEWKYIRIMAKDDKQLALSALVKANRSEDQEHQFIVENIADETMGKLAGDFPQTPDFYEPYDAVFLETNVFSQLSPAAVDALVAFVQNKGGGLLLRGSLEPVPDAFRKLLPFQETQSLLLAKPARATIAPQAIFTQDRLSPMGAPNGFFLPKLTTLTIPTQLKISARIALETVRPIHNERINAPLLVVHAYGAGKVAFTAISDTWKWRLESDQTAEIHRQFWKEVIYFLAQSAKPRLNPLNHGQKIQLDTTTILKLDVLGQDFKPAPDAKPILEITGPDNENTTLEMQPSLDEPGQYEALINPRMPGLYKLKYNAKIASAKDEIPLTANAIVVATASGLESLNLDPDQELLRDLARITEGRFYNLDEFKNKPDSIPISSRIPTTTSTTNLISPTILYAVFAVAFIAAISFRRRIGLK